MIDRFNGQSDLEEGVIRAIGETSLTDDPVRMLRAVRQSASLAMAIDPQTAEWIKTHAALIANAPAERVRDELNKTLQRAMRRIVCCCSMRLACCRTSCRK